MQVPKNKRIYVGGRRYVEGDILPPHVIVNNPELMESEPEKPKPKPRKRGTYKKREIY